MEINTKKTSFEVEFFANSCLERDWWQFALPTIFVSNMSELFKITFHFAFWYAGVEIYKRFGKGA